MILDALRKIGCDILDIDEKPSRYALPPDANCTHIGVVALDASPSMLDDDWPPSRIAAAKEAALAYIQCLRDGTPNAFVGVVSYSSHARVECSLTAVRDFDALKKRINGITTGSWTNITVGLRESLKLLVDVSVPAQVILLTDGKHNKGSQPISIARDVRRTATLETIGIGGSPNDVNENLLREIASAYPDGTKRYRWIGEPKRLVQEFQSLAGRLSRT